MFRQGHLIAVVVALLIEFTLLLVVGCAALRSEAPKEQGHTEAAKDQAHPEPCERARTIHMSTYETSEAPFITNDVPGCPKGGTLSGTKKPDYFAGKDGEDVIRGLGGSDYISGGLDGDIIYGGPGNDVLIAKYGWDEIPHKGYRTLDTPNDRSKNVLHGGPGGDTLTGAGGDDVLYGGDGDDKGKYAPIGLSGGRGEDVLYGGDGNDILAADKDGQRDELYCGVGKDGYVDAGEKIDYVDSSCEVKKEPPSNLVA